MKINLISSGSFLNIKKPKLISMDKYSCNIKKVKLKNDILNISSSKEHAVNSIIQTTTNSKDEIINILKERISILEKKVQFLENENINNNINKSNFYNLSYSNTPKKFPNFNLNMKYFKTKPNFLNIFAPMKSYKRRAKTNSNNHTIKSNYNFNNIHISNNSIKSKNKYSTVIPKIFKQKLLLINTKKRSLIKSSTVENIKFSTIERSISNDSTIKNNKSNKSSNNIPKVPKRKLLKLKSALINNVSEKNLIRNYSCKNNMLNRSNSNNSSSNSNIDNDYQKVKNSSFSEIKNKMEKIKKRTEQLLRFYSNNNKNK